MSSDDPTADVELVWIDGRLVPSAEAVIPAVSPGVQVGLGVFESLVVLRGAAFAMSRHLRRLAGSAAILGIDVPYSDAELRGAVEAVIGADDRATKVRITVSSTGDRTPPVVVVNGIRQPDWPEAARIVVSPFVRNAFAPTVGAKATSYVDNLLARRAAQRVGADEALLCDGAGHVSEGTASNVFCEIDGALCTPSLANGGLGGVTRELLCEIVPVTVRDDIGVAELRGSSEVFITASTRGVHPVASIDGVAVSECPGPLTVTAADAFSALCGRTLDP